MKKNFAKTAAACGLCLTLLSGAAFASADFSGSVYQTSARPAFSQMGQMNQMGGGFAQTAATASSAGEIVSGLTTNSAASLEADYANATTITMTDENNEVKIKEAGTYIVTGSCADGSITVTKGTTGVVLVLKDLTLTSTSGAPLSVNKSAEAKIIVSGSVTLTDNENPADETSTDADVADAYDGAAIKIKAGASACITGTGTLTVNGNAKNGIKAGDETALVIDGPVLNITASNDAINGSYDVAILSGKLTISAGDDALHADRVLTVGENGSGPEITVKTCTEGVEATVVNLAGGTVNVTSTDDGVNAANSDGTYASLGYSINVTGASVTVNAPRADGLDSNGNINLVSGSATISSASTGGDAGMDYDGQLYVSDSFSLNNKSGVSTMGGGMMGGMMGGMGGQMGGQMGGMMSRNGQTAPTQNQNTAQNSQNTQNSQSSTAQQPAQQAPMQGQQGMMQSPVQGQQGMMQSPVQGQQGMTQSPTQGQQGMTQNPAQGQQGMMQNPMQGQQGMMQNPMQGQQGMMQSPMQGQQGMMRSPMRGGMNRGPMQIMMRFFGLCR